MARKRKKSGVSTQGGRKVRVKAHTRRRRGPNKGHKTVKQRTVPAGRVKVHGYARKRPRGQR